MTDKNATHCKHPTRDYQVYAILKYVPSAKTSPKFITRINVNGLLCIFIFTETARGTQVRK